MTSYPIQAYDDALQLIIDNGKPKSNKRTGIKTLFVPCIESRYPLNGAFPLVTRRKVWPKAIFAELLWVISGSTNNRDLNRIGAKIWDPWVDERFEREHGYAPGSFGPVYGFQLRHFGGYYGNGIGGHDGSPRNRICATDFDDCGFPFWKDDREECPRSIWRHVLENQVDNVYGFGGFDQLAWMVNRLREDSSCRRIIFSMWDPKRVCKMKLPPCHYTYQIMVDDDGILTGSLTQRSCDFPIGVPANIQFYSALTIMFAQLGGFTPGEFVHHTIDSHIYWDQLDQVKQYLSLPKHDCPHIDIEPVNSIDDYKLDSFELSDYQSGPKIEIPVAV